MRTSQVYTHSRQRAPATMRRAANTASASRSTCAAVTLKNQGAPVEIIVPTDGVGFDLEGTAILQGTKNADAAEAGGLGGDARGRWRPMAAGTPCWPCRVRRPAVKGYPAEFEATSGEAWISAQVAADSGTSILKAWARALRRKSAPRN